MRSFIQILVNLIAIALVALGGWQINSVLGQDPDKRFSFPKSEKTWTVDVTRASLSLYQPEILSYGRVRATETIAIKPDVAGEVLKLGANFAEGGRVKQGELLVELDPISLNRQVDQLRTQIADQRSQRAETQANLQSLAQQLERDSSQLELLIKDQQRQEDLVKKGFATRAQLDQAQRSTFSAEQSVFQRQQSIESSKARLKQIDQAEIRLRSQLDEALERSQDAKIFAPIDGILTGASLARGESINAGATLANLANISDVDVVFELTEREFARFIDPATGQNQLVGSEIALVWKPGLEPLVYDAVVERVSPSLSQTTAGLEVFAGIVLKPGQSAPPLDSFVTVELQDRPYPDVLQIDQAALHAGSKVFVVEDDRRLKGYDAVRLKDEGSQVVLRVQDLPENACVMTTNLPVAGDGIKVAMPGESVRSGRPGGGRPGGGRPGGGRPGGAPAASEEAKADLGDEKPGLISRLLALLGLGGSEEPESEEEKTDEAETEVAAVEDEATQPGRPNGQRGEGRPQGARGEGRPQGARGEGRPQGARGEGRPQGARGEGGGQRGQWAGNGGGQRGGSQFGGAGRPQQQDPCSVAEATHASQSS